MGILQGCTIGFWRQEQHFDDWVPTGFAPNDDFDTVFGRDAFDPNITLLQALELGGGGLNNLARQAVAALLSAAHPDVAYPLTVAQVISMFQAAFDSGVFEPTALQFDEFNNLGCPL
ncbi:hypothetical protein [Calidifontibacillus oryziterrae]|uniref:hypothetical protein n=1 Tax=Calidifontibacillus oryziterrae TaxID=1191699 RepID=UPI0002F6E706|nr:hypothetical protein [Calidifontibacillus oryziterrae]